jgi:ATPase subunit of ABC transporter with duplicated ATPase domains
VIEFDKISKAYGDTVLYENLSYSVPPGGVVGIIGPNGAGKTTLFRMITGQEKPTSGTIRIGETVKLAYVDQSRDTLEGEKSVWDEISGSEDWLTLGTRKVNSRAYVASFNFLGADQQQKVKTLSGGQRNRVHLAKTLKSGGNVLLLDEPTNDLDVNTMRALEEAISNFAGSAMIISHDRWFLDRVCTHILAFEDDGTVTFFYGNCADYEEDRRKRLGKAAETPHRLTHRKLMR